jgi:aminopeptidase N
MFHRETDAKKVARNREAIFDLHAASLAWLEDYTAIPYRFGKFDFVAIPSFQFGGMEHPGAVFYNASSLLLDESATENQLLGRASLIAHETSHMWFGDLVTMRWFNDVWMKEVFANFMAAKIVNPSFPKVNHELRFLVAHYPAAYAVDRTAGTHPIRQELANLAEAGSLYGAIIYQKAPIVMRQLERLLGVEALRDGLRAYLKQFEFGNATWLDLVRVLDERTDRDLAAWSRVWVEESGRPVLETSIETNDEGRRRFTFLQRDPQGERALFWPQQMQALFGTPGGLQTIDVELRSAVTELPDGLLPPEIEFVLPNGGGLAYGEHVLDARSRDALVKRVPTLEDPVARGAAWVTLWDEMLAGRVPAAVFLDTALAALAREQTEQIVQLVSSYVEEAFWRFSSDEDRAALAPRLERTLRSGLQRASGSSAKATYFNAFRSIVTTRDGVAFLERVWRRTEKVPGLVLAEPDEATMALELAVRSVPNAAAILEEQRKRFANPDRKARFEFVMPALSERPETRDLWFKSLADVANRRREPWVEEGLAYLHHPLRAGESLRYIRPALDLLQEIQRTGDIFFPTDWTHAVLGGHRSKEAAETVRSFLDGQPDYPIRLKRVVLQAADDLFRAAGAS